MAKGKTFRARRARKPSMKKAKQMITKLHKKKAKKNMDTFFLRAKVQTTLTPVQGVTVGNYIYRHFPLMDPSSSLGVTQIPEFNLYRVQYDKVRINSIHVKFLPKGNVLDQARAQNEAAYNVTGSGLYHTVIDRDGQAPSNVAALERYPSYKKHNVLKPASRMYSIRWPVNEWLDTANIYGSDLTLKGTAGGITIYAENLLEDSGEIANEPFCSVEVYYNCVFQGKTSASLSVDCDTGAVTLTPHSGITNLEFSPLGTGTQTGTGCSGQVLTYDNSGNPVTIGDRGDHTLLVPIPTA